MCKLSAQRERERRRRPRRCFYNTPHTDCTIPWQFSNSSIYIYSRPWPGLPSIISRSILGICVHQQNQSCIALEKLALLPTLLDSRENCSLQLALRTYSRNSNYDCQFLCASAQTDYYSIYSFPPASKLEKQEKGDSTNSCCRPSPVFLYRNKKRTLSSTGNIARHHAPSLLGAESTAVHSYWLISIIFLIMYNIASMEAGSRPAA